VAEAPIVAAMSESRQTSPVSISGVSPMPTDEEVVAILSGAEALWPKPVAAVDTATPRHTTWRFSGRWWSRPVPARRDRPFR
jgi:hypothetical protein